MARITILPGHNQNAIADLAGSNRQNLSIVDDELEVPDVTQAALDAAFADYVANQVDRDNDFGLKLADEKRDREKDEFDDKSDLTALIKEMVDQLNVLRALHALPALNFGPVNADIRNRIGQP